MKLIQKLKQIAKDNDLLIYLACIALAAVVVLFVITAVRGGPWI